jgi:hypothetical protein
LLGIGNHGGITSRTIANQVQLALMLYAYAILCAGCYAAYLDASAISVILVGALLALPNVVRVDPRRKFELIAHSLAGLIFSSIAYAIGRGIALVLAA